ncbi:MAG: NAD(P)/FAD-dependent oxidoreductase [Bdellovibrionales bacterium]|nr:NAD(P)/FAD-dependent oxidoreductase [Bdellovibrionales bacterium]
MANKTQTTTNFDAVVVGAGLSGLLIFKSLQRQGLKPLLLEQRDAFGGQYRHFRPGSTFLPTGLDAFPQSHFQPEVWDWFETLLGRKVELREVEFEPKCYENAEIKDFIGFGERNFKTTNLLSDLNSRSWLHPEIDPTQWVSLLIEPSQSLEHQWTLQEVTNIDLHEGNYEITINGGKKVQSPQVFFTPSPKILLNICSHDQMGPKTVSRLAKSLEWSATYLHFNHGKLEAPTNRLFFLYGGQDQNEPCVGRCFLDPEGDQMLSCWMTLTAEEEAESHEHMGQVIRNVRKLLKRALPELDQNLVSERIAVFPRAQAELQAQIKNSPILPEFDGFFLASHLMQGFFGPVGHIRQAYEVMSGLEGKPQPQKPSETAAVLDAPPPA